MGPSISIRRDSSSDNRRQSRVSVSELIRLPSSTKAPLPSPTKTSLPSPIKTSLPPLIKEPVPKPTVNEPTKCIEIHERDLAFLCSQTNFPPGEIVRWHKKFFQDNPSGRLDQTGFRKLYCFLRNEGPERLNNVSDHIFRAFDVDGNGYVEFGEFLLGFAVCSSGDLRARLAYAFQCYDIDSNGYLTEDEIELVLRSMYTLSKIEHKEDYPTVLMAKDLMKKLDTSNSGKVSRDEFIDGLMKDTAYSYIINPFR